MKWYIAVKMRFVGELYDVSGPYNTFEEAEEEFDMLQLAYKDIIEEDQYLGIVSRKN